MICSLLLRERKVELSIEYQIRLISFPNTAVKEAVTENEDGTYTIFISDKLSSIEQQEAFLHAYKHIAGNDFTKENVNEIEFNAHCL